MIPYRLEHRVLDSGLTFAAVFLGIQEVPAGKPPPTSCRAGAVVNLLASNNNKVPVTLQLQQVDDGENLVTVVKVCGCMDMCKCPCLDAWICVNVLA